MSLDILARLLPDARIDEANLLRTRLEFVHFGIDFAANDFPLFEAVRRHFSAFVVERPETVANSTVCALQLNAPRSRFAAKDFSRAEHGRKIKEEFADLFEGRLVRKKRSGVEMFFDGHNHLIWGPLTDNPHQVTNFINLVYARHYLIQKGYVLWNAGAFANARGDVIATAGLEDPARGSLAVRLLDRGYALCSHDRLMLRAEGERVAALGYPTLPTVHASTVFAHPALQAALAPEARAGLLAMSRGELLERRNMLAVDVPHVYGPGRFRLDGALRALYLIRWTTERDQPFAVRPLDAKAAMQELAMYYKDLGVFDLNNTHGERLVTPNWTHLRRIFAAIQIFLVEGRVNFDGFLRHAAELCPPDAEA